MSPRPFRDRERARIADSATRAYVEATLVTPIKRHQIEQWRFAWQQYKAPLIAAGLLRDDAPSDWQWEDIRLRAANAKGCETFALAVGTQLQAMMLLYTGHFSQLPESEGARATYVARIEVAPWNRRHIVRSARYRGCGAVMIAAAIRRSIQTGGEGRIVLHSLPTAEAETFYRRSAGLTDCAEDTLHGALRRFEFSAEAAKAYLAKINA